MIHLHWYRPRHLVFNGREIVEVLYCKCGDSYERVWEVRVL